MMQTATTTVSYEIYQQERDRRIKAERERDTLRNELFLLRKIRRAPALKPVSSAILEEFRHVEKWGKVKDADGNTRANFTTIANNLHISADTVARQSIRLEKLGILKIHEHSGPQDEYDRKYVHILEEKLATIDKLEDTEQVIPKQGGNRYVCQTCGSTRVAKRTVTSLKCLEPECGHETIIEDTGWKEQNGHNVQKQHAFGDTNIVEEEPAASFDTQKQNAEHSNLNTHPALRSDLEIEQDAGQLLLDIAGENASHIEMIPREQKYTTVPYALNQDDMIAHLRGKRTKGAKLYYADGTLRGMMFDGDNHQDWQHLKDAAKLLQAVGFNPILEPSPAPIDSKHEGGGHLVIVFAERVDAYSAFQTVYQYTGDLLQSVEQWPSLSGGGNNVRLPGGKYIKPGFQAWCNLYNADGLVLSHDGTGAAHALLQYQTPIDLVNQYERPVVEPPVKLAPKPQTSMGGYLGKDVAPSVIADFNDTTSWDELAARTGGYNRQGYFPASWRGDRNPNVKVNPKTDLAKDFSRNAWLDCPMDKYQVYCLIEGGSDWQAFRKRDLAQRCRGYREQAIAS